MRLLDSSEQSWWAKQEKLDAARSKALAAAALVGLGNGLLMWALATHPLPDPASQLAAGAVAMGLHGWGGWEIAKVMGALGKASGALRKEAAEAFKEAVLSARKKD